MPLCPFVDHQLQGLIFYLISYKAQVLLCAQISRSRALHVRVIALSNSPLRTMPNNLSRENIAQAQFICTAQKASDLNSELEVFCYSHGCIQAYSI